jgi:hypothetical protein
LQVTSKPATMIAIRGTFLMMKLALLLAGAVAFGAACTVVRADDASSASKAEPGEASIPALQVADAASLPKADRPVSAPIGSAAKMRPTAAAVAMKPIKSAEYRVSIGPAPIRRARLATPTPRPLRYGFSAPEVRMAYLAPAGAYGMAFPFSARFVHGVAY